MGFVLQSLFIHTLARNAADGRQCAGCGRADAQLHRCARCKGAWYCSSDCQKQHWPQHQPACAGAPAAAAAAAPSADPNAAAHAPP
eukprot:gene57247-biopygen50404